VASLMSASPLSPGDRRIAIITRPRLPVPVTSTLNGACKRRAPIWPTRLISGVEQGDVSGELGKPAQGNRLGDPNLTPLGVLPVRAVAHPGMTDLLQLRSVFTLVVEHHGTHNIAQS